MRHIHTSIVSRHLATRGNNKILRTLQPHISSSEEILPRINCRTFAQLRTNKSPFLKSYLHKIDAKLHPSPLCPLCNTHTHDTHHLFNFTHICTTLAPLDLWAYPAGVTALLVRWTEKLDGGPQARTSDSPPPPLSRAMGVGRQQQQIRRSSKAAKLVHIVAVFTDTQLDTIDAELINGNEAIYHTMWCINISVDAFVNSFVTAFDRAHQTYIIPRRYVLSCNTIFPSKAVFMKSDANKTQLIKYLCNVDINNPHLHLIGDTSVYQHKEADVK